jgi:hypothetical protein
LTGFVTFEIIQRLSVFSFEILNIDSAPEIFKEDIENKKYLFCMPENTKTLRRFVTISTNHNAAKYVFLKCFNLNIFNLKL